MTLTLRLAQETDIPYITSVEHTPDYQQFVGYWSPEKHRDALTDPAYKTLLFVVDDRPVGYCILASLDSPDDAIQLKRICIGETGQGYGRQALRRVKDHVFSILKAHRLWLDVRDFNHRAENLYQSEGFRHEGRLKEASKVGDTFCDLNLYGILRSEWKKSAP